MGTQATQGCSSRWVPQDLRGPCPAGFLEEVAGKEGTAEEVSDVAHPHRAGVLEPRRGRRGSRLEPSLSPGQWPQLPLLWPLSRCPACCPQWGLSRLRAPQPAGFCPLCPSSGSQSCRQRYVCFPPRGLHPGSVPASAQAPPPRGADARARSQVVRAVPAWPEARPGGSLASGACCSVCGRGIKGQGTWRASRGAEWGALQPRLRQGGCGAGVGRHLGQRVRAGGPWGRSAVGDLGAWPSAGRPSGRAGGTRPS